MVSTPVKKKQLAHSEWYASAMERLLETVQALSHARHIDEIREIVRHAARELTGADGATFVLREGDKCYYADEDAISPLWKGRRFPLNTCISGWAMMHAESVIIEDIYADPRIPQDAYRPTFVKSLAMVPIRREAPIGAIGNYWAKPHRATAEELAVLEALASTTSVAMENARLYGELQQKVHALQESNYELSRFAWVASHDLQEPLRTVITQIELLDRRYRDKLDERAHDYIASATRGARRLQHLIEDMLEHAHVEKIDNLRPCSLADMVRDVCEGLQSAIAEAGASVHFTELPRVWADPLLVERLLQNLISNAIKFRKPDVPADIGITARQCDNDWIVSVKDNGIGIPACDHEKIFGLFQRLHSQDDYPGSGIGLATSKKVVEMHGGRIWVESEPGGGSTFHFTLPASYFHES